MEKSRHQEQKEPPDGDVHLREGEEGLWTKWKEPPTAVQLCQNQGQADEDPRSTYCPLEESCVRHTWPLSRIPTVLSG